MRDYAELVKGLRDCSRRNARVCMICGAKASNLCEGTKSKRMFYAADAIEELLKEVQNRENDCVNLTGECATYYAQIPKWHPVSEQPKRSNPKYAREEFIVRLESGCIMSLTYEFDNSDRFRDGCEPLFPAGWRKTASPITHWTEMPKFEPPKGVE